MVQKIDWKEPEGITHHFGDAAKGNNTYIRQGIVKKGHSILKHVHDYDHFSLLAQGEAILFVDGEKPADLVGPVVILVKANISHSVYAKTDLAWFCIHAPDGEINDLDKVTVGDSDKARIGG